MNKDNPYEKNIPAKCSICGRIAFKDNYGNGECPHCGWRFSKREEQLEKDMGISYPMLVPPFRAREQYKQGKPFKATFEDFINGLFFYSEMMFKHSGTIYEVFLKPDYTIVFCCEAFQQEYPTREDFENKANIDERLLKDIWDTEVEDPSYMWCG